MFFIKIYIKQSYINCYHTSIQMCGQYCILAPNCPPLSEYFHTSTFELDLTTGRVYTFLTPPEDIGVPCQQEQFDLELGRKTTKRH